MQKKLKVGILGTGWVAPEYIKSFKNNNYCEIVALCNKNTEKANNIKIKFNLDNCKILNNIDDLLNINEIDIICILTPHYLHAKHAIKCAEAGKNFIIEKPIAINWKEAKYLEGNLKKYDVKHIVETYRIA